MEISSDTPSILAIICVKNVGAKVVCGFFMKYAENMKKIVGAVWELPANRDPRRDD